MGECRVIFVILFVTSSTSAKDADGFENLTGDAESSCVTEPAAIW